MDLSRCLILPEDNNAVRLGMGGGASVYVACWYGCRVVAKVVPAPGPVSDGNEVAREWFNNELAYLPRLFHPNVVMYNGNVFLRDSGVHALLLKLEEGSSLQLFCELAAARRLPVRADTVLRIGVQLCNALTYIHDMGLIHADIKPGNILLSEGPSVAGGALALPHSTAVKLCDFGICLDTRDPQGPVSLGFTPGFLAPECAGHAGRGGGPSRSSRTTARDMYAVGVVLFLLLIPDRGPARLSSARESVGVTAEAVSPPLWPTANMMATDPLYATCRKLPVVVDLAQQLLNEDPAQRPTAPWVQRRLDDVLDGLQDSDEPLAAPPVVAPAAIASTGSTDEGWPANVGAGPQLLANGHWAAEGLPATGNHPPLPALDPPLLDPAAAAAAAAMAAAIDDAAVVAVAMAPHVSQPFHGWAADEAGPPAHGHLPQQPAPSLLGPTDTRGNPPSAALRLPPSPPPPLP